MDTSADTPKTYPAPKHPAMAIFLYVLAMVSTAAGFVGGVMMGSRSSSGGWSYFGWWMLTALGLIVAGRVLTYLWRMARALERLSPPQPIPFDNTPQIDSSSNQ